MASSLAPLVAQAQALAAAIRTMDPASARSFFKSVTVNNPDAVAVAIDVEDLLRQIRRDRAED
ncbi:hypothetical protein FRB95_004386 [Tulasnella sp. JGI-2019a]|nr:hypothetical protein FRB93_013841 [Tulasnella sp. JGI-2019a]KAG9039914.1 hypothetical protein FRB95_004386 [Tulasnella sp. JGI-2019a]